MKAFEPTDFEDVPKIDVLLGVKDVFKSGTLGKKAESMMFAQDIFGRVGRDAGHSDVSPQKEQGKNPGLIQ